jgi:hypothetical protein
MTWRYYTAILILTLGFVFTVLPFLLVAYVAGWIWCCTVDGFTLARMTYKEYKDIYSRL